MTSPPPLPPPAIGPDTAQSAIPWAIAVHLLSIAGGGWVGHAAEAGSGVTMGLGAVLMMLALILSIAAAHRVGLMVGVAMLGQRGLSALRRAGPPTDAERAARDVRDERRLSRWVSMTAICTLLALAPVVAIAIWMLAADASLAGSIGRAWVVATALAILIPRALPAIDEVQFGGTAPL